MKRQTKTARTRGKGLTLVPKTDPDEGQWIEEPVTDYAGILAYKRMWDMLYELALPHALRILAERDAALQTAA